MNDGRFGMRLDRERRSRWETAAKKAGLSLATWIKLACDEAAKGRIAVVPIESEAGDGTPPSTR